MDIESARNSACIYTHMRNHQGTNQSGWLGKKICRKCVFYHIVFFFSLLTKLVLEVGAGFKKCCFGTPRDFVNRQFCQALIVSFDTWLYGSRLLALRAKQV